MKIAKVITAIISSVAIFSPITASADQWWTVYYFSAGKQVSRESGSGYIAGQGAESKCYKWAGKASGRSCQIIWSGRP